MATDTRSALVARNLTRWATRNTAAPVDPGALSDYRDQLTSLSDEQLAAMLGAPTQHGPMGATQDPNKLIALAKGEIGKRYAGPVIGEADAKRWGDPGWDCSSFVSGMYSKLGIKLTPYTDTAAKETQKISTAEAVPGDIVFYQYADSSQPGVTFPHMGIYLGEGQMIDASYGGGVKVRPLLNQKYEIHRAPGAEQFLMQGNIPAGGEMESTTAARGRDLGYTAGSQAYGRYFNPRRDRPQTWDEAAGFLGDAAKNAGLSPDETKAAIAIMAQEGGWNGTPGDGGASHGALHFYDKGQLQAFARDMNMSPAAAGQLLDQAPMAGVDWALRGYLGQAIRAGSAQGLTGRDLVAAGVTGGQNPRANPATYQAQYDRLFGAGQEAPSLSGTATSAGVAPRFGLPPLSLYNVGSPEGIWDAIDNTLAKQQDLVAALGPDADPNQIKEIQDATETQVKMLTWLQERGDTEGWRKLQTDIQREGLAQQAGFHADDVRHAVAVLAQGDKQFQQTYNLDLRKFMELELPQGKLQQRIGEASLTGRDPETGEPTPNYQAQLENQALQRGELTGVYNDQPTLGARSLEEQIAQHQDTLRSGFADLSSRQAQALEEAQRQAEIARGQLMGQALPEGQEYVTGFEPGGSAATTAGLLGQSFNPTRYTPTYINPGAGIDAMREAFGRIAAGFPQPR